MNLPNIFFGIAADFPVSHKTQEFEETLLGLIEKLSCSNIVINNQVHGASGITIEKKPKQPVTLRADDGDYLITAQPGVAIGVMTADCLPVVFYAPDKHVIAVAHAGWRGSVAGISTVVIDQLVATFSIDTAQLKVWFGPAGKNCCYEVQADFASPWPELMHKRNGKYFFDNIHLSELNFEFFYQYASVVTTKTKRITHQYFYVSFLSFIEGEI